MTGIVTGRGGMPGVGVCVLGLALLASGCADVSLEPQSSDDLFGSYDDDGDGMLGPAEWDQVHIGLDTNGDGFVSRDEFDSALGDGR